MEQAFVTVAPLLTPTLCEIEGRQARYWLSMAVDNGATMDSIKLAPVLRPVERCADHPQSDQFPRRAKYRIQNTIVKADPHINPPAIFLLR